MYLLRTIEINLLTDRNLLRVHSAGESAGHLYLVPAVKHTQETVGQLLL